MTCDEFLKLHSEYLDDRLPLPEVARMRRHMRVCDSCARYDRVVEQGRRALRSLPYAEPSSSFYAGLRARLAEADAEIASGPSSSSFATGPASVMSTSSGVGMRSRGAGADALATLSIAALIAAVAWSALLRTDAEVPTVELSPMVAQAPAAGASAGLFSPASRFLPSAEWPDRWWRGSGTVLGGTASTDAGLGGPVWDGSPSYSPVLLDASGVGGGLRTIARPAYE